MQKPVEAGERQIEKFVSQLSNEANRMVREYNKRSRQNDKSICKDEVKTEDDKS